MNASAKSILQQAIPLSAVERGGLVDELFESLHKTGPTIDALWLREAESCIAANRSGDLDAVEAQDVFSDLGKKV